MSPVSLPAPSPRGAVHTTATRPAGAMTQSPRPDSRPCQGFSSPSAEWVAGALHSSPTGSRIELPIIVHYCWQLQSLAGLRGNWPDCGGVGPAAEALPALSTQKLSGQQPQPLGTHSDLDLPHSKPWGWGGDLGLVPGTDLDSGAGGCQGGQETHRSGTTELGDTTRSQLFFPP